MKLKPNIFSWLCVGLVCLAASNAQAQSQSYVAWSSGSSFSLGSLTGTAATSNASNYNGSVLGSVNTGAGEVNFPGAWYSPTPPAGTTWSFGVVGNAVAGSVGSVDVTVNFSRAVTNPRFHLRNADSGKLDFQSPAVVSRLSGNNQFEVSGSTLNASSSVANNSGCEALDGSNPSGACGTVQLTGTYSSFTFRMTDTNTATDGGDGFGWTLSLDAFTVGGTVSGLAAGESVTLTNNGAGAQSIATNGAFSLAAPLLAGDAYAIAVASSPAGKTCVVGNASGNITTANITNVTVVCTAIPYTLGGTVSGLDAGDSLVLTNNGANNLTVSTNGAFTFSNTLTMTSPYVVVVATPPIGKTCTVSNGSGSIGTSNVTNVTVTCVVSTFGIGGTVTGMPAGMPITLLINGGSALVLNANGAFTFPAPLAWNTAYAVTVGQQPYGVACKVTNGSGTVTAVVSNIAIACEVLPLSVPAVSPWSLVMLAFGLIVAVNLAARRRR